MCIDLIDCGPSGWWEFKASFSHHASGDHASGEFPKEFLYSS
jgi:hypothetical protein